MKQPDTDIQRSPMTGEERKRAFKAAAAHRGQSLSAAALLECGVTWDHLSRGISDLYETPLSLEAKTKFAAYIGKPVEEVFDVPADDATA